MAIFSLCIDHCVEAASGCASVPLVYMNGVYASWKDDLNMVLSDINCVTSKVKAIIDYLYNYRYCKLGSIMTSHSILN